MLCFVFYTLSLCHLTQFNVSHWKNNYFMEEKKDSLDPFIFLSCVSHQCKNKLKVSPLSDSLLWNKLSFTLLLPLPSVSIYSAFGSRTGTFQNDFFGPKFLNIRCWETQKPKSQNRLSPQFLPLLSLPPRQVFVIPRWAKQPCVYRFTVAGRGGLLVCRPGFVSHTVKHNSR